MRIVTALLSVGIAFLAGCSESNNLLLGRVEATVGTHRVVVTDCYRTSVPKPQRVEGDTSGKETWRFTPCRDADILIRGDEVSVNGRSFGRANPTDEVLVDHGVVSINPRPAQTATGRKPSGGSDK